MLQEWETEHSHLYTASMKQRANLKWHESFNSQSPAPATYFLQQCQQGQGTQTPQTMGDASHYSNNTTPNRSSAGQVSGNTSQNVSTSENVIYKYTSLSPELTRDELLDHFSTYLFFLCQFLPSFGVCSCFQYGASSCSARPSF